MEKMQEAYCGCFARPKLRADKGLLEASHFFLNYYYYNRVIVEINISMSMTTSLALSIFFIEE
jgi:hypothetical protein